MLFPEAAPLTCQLTNRIGLPWGLSGFPGGSDGKASVCNAGDLGVLSGKESACSAGDAGSIPGSGRSLEKEMAIHSSILAWRIPWTKKPGGLQSMGSQRVGDNWATKHQQQ